MAMKFPYVIPDIDYVEFFSGSGNLARAVRAKGTSSAKYGVGPCSGRTNPLISFFHSLFLFVSLSLSLSLSLPSSLSCFVFSALFSRSLSLSLSFSLSLCIYIYIHHLSFGILSLSLSFSLSLSLSLLVAQRCDFGPDVTHLTYGTVSKQSTSLAIPSMPIVPAQQEPRPALTHRGESERVG